MSVAELVLDYIQALIWPALIAVGVFWLFRSQLGSLLAERRVKSVEAAGVKVELEQVAEALKENVDESREQVAKAQDPEERERAVQKLQRDAAALGRVEATQALSDRWQMAQFFFRGQVVQLYRPASNPLSQHETDLLMSYLTRLQAAADDLLPKAGIPSEFESDPVGAAGWRIRDFSREGLSVDESISRLGPPEQFVDKWIKDWKGRENS
jgi:hypothetical protein